MLDGALDHRLERHDALKEIDLLDGVPLLLLLLLAHAELLVVGRLAKLPFPLGLDLRKALLFNRLSE